MTDEQTKGGGLTARQIAWLRKTSKPFKEAHDAVLAADDWAERVRRRLVGVPANG